MKKLVIAVLLCLFAGVALAQGIYFPGPGFKTISGGFTNLKSLITGASGKSMTRTQGAGTSQKKMTFNFWFRTPSDFTTSGQQYQINTADATDMIIVQSGAGLVINTDDGAASNSATTFANNTWYQFTFQLDTANATAGNRIKLFVNGTNDTSIGSPFTLNYNSKWGATGTTETFILGGGNTNALVDEFSKTDNQLLAPSSFATSNIPIDISALTFGAQGYWIRFETGVAATVGNDSSGVGNNFTNGGFVAGDFSSTVP